MGLHNLPIELVQEIFLRCTSSCSLYLSQVCAVWRYAAITIPQIWCFHTIHELTERRISLLELCLTRSTNQPVGLSVHASSDSKSTTLTRFLCLLEDNLPKLKSLAITLPLHSQRSFLEALQRRGAPLLEELDVRSAADHPGPLTSSGAFPIVTCTLAPRLQTLSWCSPNPISVPLPIQLTEPARLSLTSLTITSLTTIEQSILILSHLSTSDHLHTCRLTHLGAHGNPYPFALGDEIELESNSESQPLNGLNSVQRAPPAIHLPVLRTLELGIDDARPVGFSPLLKRLRVPRLRRLVVRGFVSAAEVDESDEYDGDGYYETESEPYYPTPGTFCSRAFEDMLALSDGCQDLRELELINVLTCSDHEDLERCLRAVTRANGDGDTSHPILMGIGIGMPVARSPVRSRGWRASSHPPTISPRYVVCPRFKAANIDINRRYATSSS
jgi:hypothetical protein